MGRAPVFVKMPGGAPGSAYDPIHSGPRAAVAPAWHPIDPEEVRMTRAFAVLLYVLFAAIPPAAAQTSIAGAWRDADPASWRAQGVAQIVGLRFGPATSGQGQVEIVFHTGRAPESRTGFYRFHRNPMLGNQLQLQFGWTEPSGRQQEMWFYLRQLDGRTLVIEYPEVFRNTVATRTRTFVR
jgi:hypothetical protein